METQISTKRAQRRTITMNNGLLFLLIISLFVSPTFAIPLSRSLNSMDSPGFIPDLSKQMELVFERYEEERGERKLLVETNDYGTTGANGKHDPSTGSK